MPDMFTLSKRRQIMSRIRSTDTVPELSVRKALRRLGERFRAYSAHLPGKPDIVLPQRKIALFVHGCFWHQHARCPRKFMPKSNIAYWKPKLGRNVARFREVRRSL